MLFFVFIGQLVVWFGRHLQYLCIVRNHIGLSFIICFAIKLSKFTQVIKWSLYVPAMATKANPQMMLQIQPIKKKTRTNCNNPTQKLMQNVPNLPPPDCPTFPQHSTLKPAITVPLKQFNITKIYL